MHIFLDCIAIEIGGSSSRVVAQSKSERDVVLIGKYPKMLSSLHLPKPIFDILSSLLCAPSKAAQLIILRPQGSAHLKSHYRLRKIIVPTFGQAMSNFRKKRMDERSSSLFKFVLGLCWLFGTSRHCKSRITVNF
jgi:hypothetical protein